MDERLNHLHLHLPALHEGGQREVIEDPARMLFLEAGTKWGKTVGFTIWLLQDTSPNEIRWWCAPYYRQVKIWYRRCRRMLAPIAEWCRFNESDLRITLPDGAILAGGSGDNPDALYGEGVTRVVIDEASRFPEEAWHAVRTTVTRELGMVRAISKPRGRRNWFFRLCRHAAANPDLLDDDGRPQYAHYRFASADNPMLSRFELEVAQRELPANVYQELYLAIAQEDAADVFRNIPSCVGGALQPGPSQDGAYCMGIDLGRYHDRTVVIVMDIPRRRVVAHDTWQNVLWEQQRSRVEAIAKHWGLPPILVDSTGVGDPILEDLVRMGLPATGYTFTSPSKQVIIQELAVDIEQTRITFPDIPQLIAELELYEYEITKAGNVRYSAPAGEFDDYVCALALANHQCGRGGLGGTVYVQADMQTAETAAVGVMAEGDPADMIVAKQDW